MNRVFFYILPPALFSIPIFYDFYYFRFVYSSEPFSHVTKVPLPIGFLAFFMFFFICRAKALIHKGGDVFYFFSKTDFVLIGVLSCFLFLYGIAVSSLSVLRVTQLIFPFLFFVFPVLSKDEKDRRLFFNSCIFSISVFSTLHLLSLLVYNSGFRSIGSVEFPMFYGISIYQSLVSYTAVLSLYFTIMIHRVLSRESPILSSIVVITISCLLLFSERKAVLLEMCLVVCTLVLFLPVSIELRMKPSRWLNVFTAIGGIGFVFACVVVGSDSFERLYRSIGEGTFSGGRSDIFSQAIEVISSDFWSFLFGFGGGDYSFHNYFIDLIFRIGALASLVYIVILGYIVVAVISKAKCIEDKCRLVFLACLFLQFFVQMMVNSPLSQPYYVVNFVLCILYLVYFPVKVPK